MGSMGNWPGRHSDAFHPQHREMELMLPQQQGLKLDLMHTESFSHPSKSSSLGYKKKYPYCKMKNLGIVSP
jgi:hypothetical protein